MIKVEVKEIKVPEKVYEGNVPVSVVNSIIEHAVKKNKKAMNVDIQFLASLICCTAHNYKFEQLEAIVDLLKVIEEM